VKNTALFAETWQKRPTSVEEKGAVRVSTWSFGKGFQKCQWRYQYMAVPETITQLYKSEPCISSYVKLQVSFAKEPYERDYNNTAPHMGGYD